MRRRINLLVAATMALVLLALGAPIALLLRSEAEQRALADATLRAQALVPVAVGTASFSSFLTGNQGLDASVRRGSGEVLGAPMPRTPSVQLAEHGRSFAARTDTGVELLLGVVSPTTGNAVIRIHVPDGTLYQGAWRTLSALAGLSLALFLLGLFVADRMARRLLVPVVELAATADRLSSGELSARARVGGPPEIHRVGTELNRLADRIAELLTAEREEVADLAHRLRTPLTALRLDVDGRAAAGDPAAPADTAITARLRTGVDEVERQVDEVIRTARRPVREGAVVLADLVYTASDRVRYWSALAEDTGRTLTADLPAGPAPIRTSAEDLRAALDALLGNVFAHTPDGVPVEVTIAYGPRRTVSLVVSDAGPGFAEDDPTRRGRSRSGSSGLGLDIARRTAEAAGGELRTGAARSGGARVELEFPLVD